MKKSKSVFFIAIAIVIFLFILIALKFITPLFILKYAEKQYYVDQFRKNSEAFENIKNELLLNLEKENLQELKLVVIYKDGIPFLYHSDNRLIEIDVNTESLQLISDSFGDFIFDHVYSDMDYISFSCEGNNYHFIYSPECSPEKTKYKKIISEAEVHSLKKGWYLVMY